MGFLSGGSSLEFFFGDSSLRVLLWGFFKGSSFGVLLWGFFFKGSTLGFFFGVLLWDSSLGVLLLGFLGDSLGVLWKFLGEFMVSSLEVFGSLRA